MLSLIRRELFYIVLHEEMLNHNTFPLFLIIVVVSFRDDKYTD